MVVAKPRSLCVWVATRWRPARSVTPSLHPGRMEHYCQAFSLQSGRCFRLIQAEDGTGHAQHCAYLAEWRGRFKDAAGKWHTLEACDGHRTDLDAVQRIG